MLPTSTPVIGTVLTTLPLAGSNVTSEFPPETERSGRVTPQTVVFWSLVRSPMSRAAAGLIVVRDPFD